MARMYDADFINSNRIFWSRFREPDTDEFLLVETSCNPAINHSNAVMGKTIARARNLRIAWLGIDFKDEELFRSYSPNSIFTGFKKFTLLIRLRLFCIAIFYYLRYVLLFDRIRTFTYKGVPYGDFVYDSYLSMFSMATFHRLDARIIIVFYLLLFRDRQARLILTRYNIKVVLISNYIGLLGGPLFRVAVQKKLNTYIKTGGHQVVTLALYKDLTQIYDYPLRPTLNELRALLDSSPDFLEKEFSEFIDEATAGFYGAFFVAYNNVIKSDITRESFLQTMSLEDKPLIFVMLHAFNDYPLSHFKNMLFKDYHDWFLQTYHFALKDKTKNWIFKEHPANDSYPTKDLNLGKIFKRLPSHIRFISYKSKIRASAVLNVADLIVTCLGTAGVEMPALKGMPSLIGGDTFFDGFGFTIDPKSREAYFDALRNFSKKELGSKERLLARCCYLYVKKYTSVPFAAGPVLTYEESKQPDFVKAIYPARILDSYKKNADMIYGQFVNYASEIQKKDFKRLLNISSNTRRHTYQETLVNK